MNNTVTDVGMRIILESQLRAHNLSWMTFEPFKDYKVFDHQLAVYQGMFWNKDGNGPVFDAWVVVAGGTSTILNKENYPNLNDAVAQHIGKLALEGSVRVVDAINVPKPIRKRKRKNIAQS